MQPEKHDETEWRPTIEELTDDAEQLQSYLDGFKDGLEEGNLRYAKACLEWIIELAAESKDNLFELILERRLGTRPARPAPKRGPGINDTHN